jgi:GNAT superfamily N-acetyltransferase
MPQPQPNIRRATVGDAAAIAAVDVASWRAAYHNLMPDAYLDALSVDEKTASWARSLRREAASKKQTFVAERDGDVIGYATVGPDGESGSGLLYLMSVTPEHWRGGAGHALMLASRDALKRDGYRMAVLWVLERNERARRFYEADGWTADALTQTSDYGGTPLVALRYVTRL